MPRDLHLVAQGEAEAEHEAGHRLVWRLRRNGISMGNDDKHTHTYMYICMYVCVYI